MANTVVSTNASEWSDGLEVCSEVIPNSLFISSYQAWDRWTQGGWRIRLWCQVAGDEEALKASGITHIVNTAADVCSELSTADSMRQ